MSERPRYVLVELEPWQWPDEIRVVYGEIERPKAVADVTDLLTYNKTHVSDPWDKPYPAMYEDMIKRL